MKKILVVGSINMDLVATAPEFPQPGQTIIGNRFETFPGGKGANQAVAAGKLGSDVSFLGKIGDDLFADQSLDSLRSAGVKTACIERERGISTGVAVIEVTHASENTIIVIPGANGSVNIDYVRKYSSVIDSCDIVMLQLEIPLETVLFTAQYAQSKGKTVILDPAPACELPDDLIACCDYITPNETELKIITRENVYDQINTIKAAQKLLQKGAKKIIHKAGKTGAYRIDQNGCLHIPGFPVNAVDTTAAGDTFNAAFASIIALGKSEEESIRYANAAAAISVTKLGAQSAMPTQKEVQRFLAERKPDMHLWLPHI